MAQSVMDQIRKLDEQRNALMENAKNEALEKAQAAVADLNSLGFHYRLVADGSGRGGARRSSASSSGARGQVQDKECPICNFKTEPPHDARRHRGQKGEKRPFTDAELEMLHMKRVS